jgi:dihydroorotate dehydrogenase electron transfer subunit
LAENQAISPGIYKMRLTLPADYPCPQPGQFVNVYLNDASRLLPRPLSVCDWKSESLTLVYAVVGGGTKSLSGCAPGVGLRVSTPLGKGYAWETFGGKPILLVGGGLGVVPLVYLAKKIPGAKAVLGFQQRPFLADTFPCPAAIATDDGSQGFRGNVLDYLTQADLPADTQMLACGPKPMLKALAQFCRARGFSLQVSLEERMGCGYGACVGCVCKTKNGNRKVCEDGPVFAADEVDFV